MNSNVCEMERSSALFHSGAPDVQNGEDIKRYTVEEIRAMRRRGESRTDWQKVDAMTDEEGDLCFSGCKLVAPLIIT
jgi:hypothetical protein